MSSLKKALSIFVVLIIVVCFGWQLSIDNPEIVLDENSLKHTIDYSLHDLQVSQFNDKGVLVNSLKTPKLEHIPHENSNLIDNPHIEMHDVNKPVWNVDAKHAKTTNGFDKVTFTDNVVINQHKDNQHSETTMLTDELTYFAKDKYAQSTHEVTFIQPETRVTAKGMKAYITEKKIQLLNSVRGLYNRNNNTEVSEHGLTHSK